MTLIFNFRLYYRTRSFSFKLGSVWYGFGFIGAKVSQRQGKRITQYFHSIQKNLGKVPNFVIVDDTNSLFLGFFFINWHQFWDKSEKDYNKYLHDGMISHKLLPKDDSGFWDAEK